MKNLGSKGIALVASLALHFVVLSLFSIWNGCDSQKKADDVPPPVETDGRANDLPLARAEEPAADVKQDVEKIPVKNADKKSPVRERPQLAETYVAQKKIESDAPVKGKKDSHVKAEEPASTPVVKAEDTEWISYKVKPGDSLTRIAKSCGCTIQELAKANKISPLANLKLGQTLKIKAHEKENR